MRRPRVSSLAIALTVAAALAVLRALPFVVWPHSAFDSDQAIVGLMAKHLAEARALPLFFYGQPYLLTVPAWLAAPLFLIGGVSIALLKVPLVAINAVTAALLVWMLVRQAGLSPVAALVASAFFVLAPPVAGMQLVAAGGSVEVFLYVLLIWLLRDRPIWCGLVAGVGFLHRELTAYGVSALLITSALYGCRRWRELAPRWLVIGAMVLAAWDLGRAAMPFGDEYGPEMPRFRPTSNAFSVTAIAGDRVRCDVGTEIAPNLTWLVERNLPTVFGTAGRGTNEYYVGPSTTASPLVWLFLWTGLLVALIRGVTLAWRARASVPPVLTFLFLVGGQSAMVYVGSCGARDPMLFRYTLLALLIAVAIAGWYLRVEPIRHLRWVAMLCLTMWLGWAGLEYLSLARSYAADPPSSPQSIMADELLRRGIRFGRAGYWDAYHITFLTNERVVLASTETVRILAYDSQVMRASDIVNVQPNPCVGELIGSLWLCRDAKVPGK